MISRDGFTLLELLISMALAVIITTAGYLFYDSQVRTRIAQERVTDMQQNLRSAMVMMGGDIRMAGYDPEESTGAGFTVANAGTLSFEVSVEAEANGIDDNGNGDIDEAAEATLPMTTETISYTLNDEDGDGDQDLVRIFGGNRVVVAENMQGLELNYLMDDGTAIAAPGDLGRIIAVNVALLARSMTPDNTFSNGLQYRGYAQTWGPYDDGYRRRLLRRTVRCRNQGI